MVVTSAQGGRKRRRAHPATAEIPVLMMTGFDPRPERAKMVEAGGDDLIVKPIAMRDLQGRVRAVLRLKELRRDLRSTPDRKSTPLNSSHHIISYGLFFL